MSFISGLKSYFFGAPKSAEADRKKEVTTDTSTNVKNNVPVFTQAKVQQSDGRANSGSQDNPAGNNDFTNTVKKDVPINTEELYKQYKKNPSDILNDPALGKEFTPEEAAELEKLLQNKGDLKGYLELAKKGNLSNKDIIEGMKELEDNKVIDFWFIHWNKLDRDKYAGNMDKLRIRAQKYASKSIAQIGSVMTKAPELADASLHYVGKSNIYSEKSALKAINYMDQNKGKALKFFNNSTKMENIKNDDGLTKYKDDTILHAAQGMTENEGLAPSIYNTALKKDMNDKYLVNITDNLIKNPLMQNSYDQFLSMKDVNGNDRFSAQNLCSQTEYMSEKTSVQIEAYRENTVQLAQHAKMSGDNIVNTAGNVTDNPQTRSEVMSMAENDKYSGDDVAKRSTQLAQNHDTTYSDTPNKTNAASSYTSSSPAQQKNIKEQEVSLARKLFDNPAEAKTEKYKALFQNENDILYLAKAIKKDSAVTDCIKILYNNPNIPTNRIVPIMRKYGDDTQLLKIYCKDPDYFEKNPDMLKLYAKNGSFFEKLKSRSFLTNTQIEQFARYAGSSSKDLIFTMLDNKIDPNKILSVLNSAANSNSIDDIKNLMQNNTISAIDKMKALQDKKNQPAKELALA